MRTAACCAASLCIPKDSTRDWNGYQQLLKTLSPTENVEAAVQHLRPDRPDLPTPEARGPIQPPAGHAATRNAVQGPTAVEFWPPSTCACGLRHDHSYSSSRRELARVRTRRIPIEDSEESSSSSPQESHMKRVGVGGCPCLRVGRIWTREGQERTRGWEHARTTRSKTVGRNDGKTKCCLQMFQLRDRKFSVPCVVRSPLGRSRRGLIRL